MHISFMAMNRMLEERAAKDETTRRQLERNRKCTLSDGRALSDEALLEKLRSLGLKEGSRNWLDHFSRKVPSAQVLATALTEHGGLDVRVDQEDWLWIALVCLWERWFPDRPNFEMLDDQMQAGYRTQNEEPLETARRWLGVWRGIEHLMATFEIESIEEFDEWFGGTNSIFNWVQDFSSALYHVAREDRSFAEERLSLCRRVLELLENADGDQLTIEKFRRDLAESHADLGEFETVDRLYAQWVDDDPRWGWGWIGWSDVYYTFAPEDRIDAARAEQILKDGLAVPDVVDQEHLVERLASLYEETGRTAEAASLLECFPDTSQPSKKQTVDDSTSESSLDEIIAELDAEYTGQLPKQAIRAAQRRREEITPRLIDLIRKATEVARAGNSVEGNGPLFALFLLTEFEAKEALPAILEAVSLPGDGPFELFGDAITEDLCRVLAALAAETPEIIDELIADRSLNEYVRWEAAQTYLLWVRDGLLTRDQAVGRLREHLYDAVINRDAELTSGLVAELVSYAPHEALDEIKEAYRRGLVDESLVGLDTVGRSIAEGESRFREELEHCRPTGVEDTVAELSRWASFREEDEHSGYSAQPPVSSTLLDDEDIGPEEEDIGPEEEEPWEPVTTIRNTAPKIGRNDPCPCGSGKKYKKCCGSR